MQEGQFQYSARPLIRAAATQSLPIYAGALPSKKSGPKQAFRETLNCFYFKRLGRTVFAHRGTRTLLDRLDAHAVIIGANRAPKLAFPPRNPSCSDIFQRLLHGFP